MPGPGQYSIQKPFGLDAAKTVFAVASKNDQAPDLIYGQNLIPGPQQYNLGALDVVHARAPRIKIGNEQRPMTSN